MGIPIRSPGEILDAESGNRSRLRPVISNINDHEFLCHFRVEQCKNKVRAAKARVHYHYIVGKREFFHLFDYCRAKAVIGKQGVSTPCNHDLRIQHGGLLTGWLLSH